MKNLILRVPDQLHRQLSELAQVAHYTPEALLLFFARSDVEQAFERGDLDFFMPCLEYDDEETARNAAASANAFENRFRKKPFENYKVIENSGKFSVSPDWQQEIRDCRKIIAFPKAS